MEDTDIITTKTTTTTTLFFQLFRNVFLKHQIFQRISHAHHTAYNNKMINELDRSVDNIELISFNPPKSYYEYNYVLSMVKSGHVGLLRSKLITRNELTIDISSPNPETWVDNIKHICKIKGDDVDLAYLLIYPLLQHDTSLRDKILASCFKACNWELFDMVWGLSTPTPISRDLFNSLFSAVDSPYITIEALTRFFDLLDRYGRESFPLTFSDHILKNKSRQEKIEILNLIKEHNLFVGLDSALDILDFEDYLLQLSRLSVFSLRYKLRTRIYDYLQDLDPELIIEESKFVNYYVTIEQKSKLLVDPQTIDKRLRTLKVIKRKDGWISIIQNPSTFIKSKQTYSYEQLLYLLCLIENIHPHIDNEFILAVIMSFEDEQLFAYIIRYLNTKTMDKQMASAFFANSLLAIKYFKDKNPGHNQPTIIHPLSLEAYLLMKDTPYMNNESKNEILAPGFLMACHNGDILFVKTLLEKEDISANILKFGLDKALRSEQVEVASYLIQVNIKQYNNTLASQIGNENQYNKRILTLVKHHEKLFQPLFQDSTSRKLLEQLSIVYHRVALLFGDLSFFKFIYPTSKHRIPLSLLYCQEIELITFLLDQQRVHIHNYSLVKKFKPDLSSLTKKLTSQCSEVEW